jgi:CTP:molybdopterin cytidylyltransferase MocA
MMTAAIILAAGKSQRLGQNKLLLRLNRGTLLDNVLNAIAAADIQEKVVVVGHNAEEIIKVVSRGESLRESTDLMYCNGEVKIVDLRTFTRTKR